MLRVIFIRMEKNKKKKITFIFKYIYINFKHKKSVFI